MASEDDPDQALAVNDEIAEQRSATSAGTEPLRSDPSVKIDERPLAEQIQEIADDAKNLVGTEIAYYRAKMTANVDAAKKILIFFGLGIAILTAGLTALIWGALITLASWIGPGAATAVIGGVSLIGGGALLLAAIGKAKKLPLDGEEK